MSVSGLRLTFEAFGARIRIELPRAIAGDVTPSLPPGARPVRGTRRDATYAVRAVPSASGKRGEQYELLRDGESLGVSRDLGRVQFDLTSDLHFQVALHARNVLFVHAGVVEWQGRAIVLPGASRSGKSSLVMALVRAGARYRSDEYAVIDRHGLVHAYPKPLAERRTGLLPLLHPAADLGVGGDLAPIPMGRVIVARFRAGGRWAPVEISKAQMLMALFGNTVVARTQSKFALAVLSRAVDSADGLEGERGEAAEVVAHLLGAKRPPRA